MASSSAKPGLTAGPEDRRAALLAGLEDPVAAVAQVVPGDERRRRHHVDARGQDADQLVDVDPHRVVDHAVRFQREQRVDVIGGDDTQRCDAAQLAGVAADLLRRPGITPHEFKSRGWRRSPAPSSCRHCRSSTGRPDKESVGHSHSVGGRMSLRKMISPNRETFSPGWQNLVLQIDSRHSPPANGWSPTPRCCRRSVTGRWQSAGARQFSCL